MSKTFKFVLLGILGIVIVFLAFWFTRPQPPVTSLVGTSENITKQLQERSFYSKLPIVYSSDKVGKDNPFK